MQPSEIFHRRWTQPPCLEIVIIMVICAFFSDFSNAAHICKIYCDRGEYCKVYDCYICPEGTFQSSQSSDWHEETDWHAETECRKHTPMPPGSYWGLKTRSTITYDNEWEYKERYVKCQDQIFFKSKTFIISIVVVVVALVAMIVVIVICKKRGLHTEDAHISITNIEDERRTSLSSYENGGRHVDCVASGQIGNGSTMAETNGQRIPSSRGQNNRGIARNHIRNVETAQPEMQGSTSNQIVGDVTQLNSGNNTDVNKPQHVADNLQFDRGDKTDEKQPQHDNRDVTQFDRGNNANVKQSWHDRDATQFDSDSNTESYKQNKYINILLSYLSPETVQTLLNSFSNVGLCKPSNIFAYHFAFEKELKTAFKKTLLEYMQMCCMENKSFITQVDHILKEVDQSDIFLDEEFCRVSEEIKILFDVRNECAILICEELGKRTCHKLLELMELTQTRKSIVRNLEENRRKGQKACFILLMDELNDNVFMKQLEFQMEYLNDIEDKENNEKEKLMKDANLLIEKIKGIYRKHGI